MTHLTARMTWTELSLDTTYEAIDWIRTLLATHGVTQPLAIQPHRPQADEPDWDFTLRLYLSTATTTRQVQAIAAALHPLHRTGQTSQLRQHPVAEIPTVDQPRLTRCGQRVRLQSSDRPPTRDRHPDDISITLKPTLSFGSGLHPTTRLCIRLLERHITPGMTTLDFGSGSGILSILMAKLGATVLAADNDPTAVQATRAAVADNHVTDRVTVIQGSLGQGNNLGHWLGGEAIAHQAVGDMTPHVDLVVTNMFARIHIALAPDFRRILERSPHAGYLLTAGYTQDYEADLCTALQQSGFHLITTERQDEWVAHLHQRQPRSRQGQS
jgi:ribosomal protein L11 methyltransferase